MLSPLIAIAVSSAALLLPPQTRLPQQQLPQLPPPPRRARTPLLQLPGLDFIPGSKSSSSSSVAPNGVPVDIAVTGINSRCISASIVIEARPELVWAIITDYDNLATHVPNLVESSRRPHPRGGIRLFQEGAQNIIGFDFRASLTMDMLEVTEEGRSAPTSIQFNLVESAMFAAFDGEWIVQPYSRSRSKSDPTKFDYKSKLSYRVNITPRGLVPVPALEWQIREEVPNNLQAVKEAAEKLKARRAPAK